MAGINVKKLFAKDSSGCYLDLENGWVSNGHWAIRISDTSKPEMLSSLAIAEAFIAKKNLRYCEQSIAEMVERREKECKREIHATPFRYRHEGSYGSGAYDCNVYVADDAYLATVRSLYDDLINPNRFSWYGNGSPDDMLVMRHSEAGVTAVLMPTRSDVESEFNRTREQLHPKRDS